MNKSKHWLDDGAPREFERLLRAARSDRPSPASVERALLAAGITGAVAVTASAAASASAASAGAGAVGAATSGAGAASAGAAGAGAVGKTFAAAAMQWLTVGAVSAGVAVTSVAVVQHREPARAPAVPTASSVRVGHPKAPKTAAFTEPVNPQPDRSSTTAVSPHSKSPPRAADAKGSRAPLPSREPSAGAPSDAAHSAEPDHLLAEEMALVDGARSELRAGDALSVLKRAAEHRRRFASGRFAPEMLFLTMQAKLKLGEREAAADIARELVRRFPTGAQASRARELLESNDRSRNF